MTTRAFGIFFRDLNPVTRRSLCEAFNTTQEEENWDVFPIAIIEREVEEKEEENETPYESYNH